RTAKEDRLSVELELGARVLHFERHAAHGTISELSDLRTRLDHDVGRPADTTRPSAELASFECVIDCLPRFELFLGPCSLSLRDRAFLVLVLVAGRERQQAAGDQQSGGASIRADHRSLPPRAELKRSTRAR